MEHSFNPDLILDHGERAQLGQLTVMPGYKIMHRIFRSEVDKFFVALINADPAAPEQVVSKQLTAKAAAMFYEQVTSRINEEVMMYTNTPRPGAAPIDITEGMLDLSDLALEEEYE